MMLKVRPTIKNIRFQLRGFEQVCRKKENGNEHCHERGYFVDYLDYDHIQVESV